MKKLLLTVLLLLWSVPAFAGTKSKWMKTGGGAEPSVATTEFWVPMGSNDSISVAVVVPAAGTVRKLYARSSVAPDNGAGTQSWTITFRNNGSDTALACTISETDTLCNDTSDSISLSVDDLVSVSTTPANTPAAGRLSWMLEFEATDASTTVWLASPPIDVSGGGTRYIGPIGSEPPSFSLENSLVMPVAGTITTMKANLATAPGAGASRTFTLMIDGSDSALAITYSDTANGIQTDTATVSVTAGQRIDLRSDATNAPPNSFVAFGFIFSPSTEGEFLIASSSSSTVSNSSVTYMGVPGIDVDFTPETNISGIGQNDIRLTACYVLLDGAPGAGTSYEFKLRQNEADASVPLTVTIADTAMSGNTSGTFQPLSDGRLAVQITPSGTPTARRVAVSYAAVVLGTRAPSCCLGVFD